MSLLLIEFAKSFIQGKISAQVFADAYIELWHIEGVNGNIPKYDYEIGGYLSSIFCLADMYNPEQNDRLSYELNDE
ncbi:colicin immunity protein, partial [Xenorhabdus sp. Flor]|uniref:colicin immunity domain-containing protein n=1 Tax=Xenorhabdus cabanillasii TaxID=351673 RepID=UPI0019B1EFF9